MVSSLSGRALLGQIEGQEKKLKSGKLTPEMQKTCETYLEILKAEANARVAKHSAKAAKVESPKPAEPVEPEAPKAPKAKKAKAEA